MFLADKEMSGEHQNKPSFTMRGHLSNTTHETQAEIKGTSSEWTQKGDTYVAVVS